MNKPDIKMAAVTLSSEHTGYCLENSTMVKAQRYAAKSLPDNHDINFEEDGLTDARIIVFGNIILDLAFVFYLNEE